jgi:hypothetical protein
MWKLIKYIFYKYYKLYKNEMGDKYPQFMGTLVVYFLSSLIIASITNFFYPYDINKKTWLIFAILLFGFCVYVFLPNNKWRKILKEFENESSRMRNNGRVIVITFTILTIVLFIVSLFFLR